jgi:signal transduction histidine kinase
MAALRERAAALPPLFDALLDQRLSERTRSESASEEAAWERTLSLRMMAETQQLAEQTYRLLALSQENLVALKRKEKALMIGLALLLVSLVLVQALGVHHLVLRPLKRLERGARAIETGDYHHRIGLHADNEIGAVAAQFDHMADALCETLGALHQQRTQLETSNAELESFSYSVSHDLRAPLRGIDGWAEALLEDHSAALDPQARECAERIRSECSRMNLLMEELLQLARVTHSELKCDWLELDLLATELAARVLEAWPKRDIHLDIQPGLTAWGDRDLLSIALTNLFDNACKFTAHAAPARITFGCRVKTDGPGTRPTPVYFIRDNGVGFDMGNAGRLFGAFQRMHSQRDFPGNGIGLAIVRRIIHRHGGDIEADARPGEGACFSFTLPLLPGPLPSLDERA